MADEDASLDNFQPSWMEDGYGIAGPQSENIQEDVADWDTNIWSENSQANEDFTGARADDCMTAAGAPPGTGTYVLGSIDGVCQWINTTTCP